LVARSKTDQEGAGAVRWLSPRTAAALRAWLDCAGIAAGPVFRAIQKNGVAKPSSFEPGEIARLLKDMATAMRAWWATGDEGGRRHGADSQASTQVDEACNRAAKNPPGRHNSISALAAN
jgi:hypothetical protein